MKNKSIIQLLVTTVNCLLIVSLKGQVSVPTNANPLNNPAFYVGWNPAVTVPLRLEHQGNQPINFSTNGSIRFLIDQGNATQAGGRAAFGNNLPSGFAPASRVHIHQTAGLFKIIYHNCDLQPMLPEL